MTTYYHGTDFDSINFDELNPSSSQIDICLTDEERIARQYAGRWGAGFVMEIWAGESLEIMDEEAALILAGADADDIQFMDTSEKFHLIDQLSGADVIAAGFDGVEYEDCLPGTRDKFTCTRLYTYRGLTIEEITEA